MNKPIYTYHLHSDCSAGELATLPRREIRFVKASDCMQPGSADYLKAISIMKGRFIIADEAGDPEWRASMDKTSGSKLELMRRRADEFAQKSS